ncbi:TetR/AcrR family transcriptional regulator [Amycolatopsis suaedae]|uniref:TetR/AcrR family transcriptional regulator n=1 Tax=Amycolatopsis suaedae TaxID=2510978 RepID=A0A4Q7J2L1_9PSEU|nr:TetR/AcrR family transcriptional regulator [Amycolatopsis suaedae]RZQ60988.1 TetR/AcrR family transcriptional regulator [Amycolatopsis suaedae]
MAGRPRDPELEQRLLSATWLLLTSSGYDALTMARVAAEANAHRSDVYRRWQTKAQLVTAALAQHLPPIPETDTGSLYHDLRANLDGLATSWSAPWMDGLLGLLADLRRDPEADAAFQAMASRRRRILAAAIDRAVRRGEITEPVNPYLPGDLLEGPLMHRQMIARRPITSEDLDLIALSAYRLLTRTLVVP